ncbi:restriction endonuclease subunit S [Flavobacterium filum]|uniref:restriction endonuclease subunit S n=1 Tax=Flavobacterium filum TaxID=370974 RepID=UPI0023F1494C|nr:restriction endonuclease subunit S [Flavobacterium filum]
MKEYFLEELLQIKNGRDHKHLPDGNIPVFGSGGLMRYVDQAIYNDESILLPRKGTLSNIQYANKPFWTVDTIYYTIINKEKANPLYLYHYLKQLDLSYLNSGTGVPSMTFGVYYSVKVKLPSLSEQQKIAKVLSDLDAKIELNNKINIELEAMAKTLYDYWFVQFDFPDANGKPYKTSGGKMVWNEELKREIPEGWGVKELSDIANIIMGQSPPGESYNEEGLGTVFYQGCTDFGNRFPTIRKYTTSPTRFAKQGDILLSVRAPVGTMNIAKENCCIGRGLASLNSKDNCIAYLFGVMVNLKQIFDRRNVDGTTFGSITKDDLFSLNVLKPSNTVLLEFDKIVNPCFQKQNKLEEENIQLSSLRDWLLPMLMNGQVSVGEVESDYEKRKRKLNEFAEKFKTKNNSNSDLELVAKEYQIKEEVLGMVAEPDTESKPERIRKARSEKSDAFLKKVMLGSHLIYSFYQEREFGHVKFMKLLYLCEQVAEMDLITNYKKAAAGPFDKKTLISIENYVMKSGWFNINKECYTGFNGKVYERTFYTLTNKSTDYLKYFDKFFELEKPKIEKLIQLFRGINSKKCEIVATTFYAWNELIKNNALVNDASLVKGFFDFHPQKGKNFKEVDVKNELPWMRENRVYPLIF